MVIRRKPRNTTTEPLETNPQLFHLSSPKPDPSPPAWSSDPHKHPSEVPVSDFQTIGVESVVFGHVTPPLPGDFQTNPLLQSAPELNTVEHSQLAPLAQSAVFQKCVLPPLPNPNVPKHTPGASDFYYPESIHQPVQMPQLEHLVPFFNAIAAYADLDRVKCSALSAKIQEALPLVQSSDLRYALNNIQMKLSCENCHHELVKVKSSCGHQLCYRCLRQVVIQATNGVIYMHPEELSVFLPECVLCNQSLTIQDLQFAAGDNLALLEKAAECRRNNVCPTCNNPFNEFVTACTHECAECVFTRIRKGEIACGYCLQPFEYFSTRICKCDVCARDVSLREEWSRTLCSNHFHCHAHLMKALETNDCQVCGNSLDCKDFDLAKDVYYSRCSQCHNLKGCDKFCVKLCCAKKVCIECQLAHSLTQCVCGERMTETHRSGVQAYQGLPRQSSY